MELNQTRRHQFDSGLQIKHETSLWQWKVFLQLLLHICDKPQSTSATPLKLSFEEKQEITLLFAGFHILRETGNR